MTEERLKEILVEIYGDAKLSEPTKELMETCKSLRITKEEANEIGCPSMADWIEEPSSFFSDKEKMIDFVALSREEFLRSYSYLTEEDYNLTVMEMLCRVEEYELFETVSEGKDAFNVVMSQMMWEWLMGKEVKNND